MSFSDKIAKKIVESKEFSNDELGALVDLLDGDPDRFYNSICEYIRDLRPDLFKKLDFCEFIDSIPMSENFDEYRFTPER